VDIVSLLELPQYLGNTSKACQGNGAMTERAILHVLSDDDAVRDPLDALFQANGIPVPVGNPIRLASGGESGDADTQWSMFWCCCGLR
jgi:hypothetical protein